MRQAPASSSSALQDSAIAELGAPIEVRRHPGARRLTLRVSRTRRAVIVTLPVQCDLVEAGSFIHRNIDWVRERLGSLPDPVLPRHGVFMPLRGEPHRIIFTGTRSAGSRPVERHANKSALAEVVVTGSTEHAPRRLRDWFLEEARRDLEARVLWHAGHLGLKPRRIAVRDQTSRWGSCSTTGVLSFSWRLILAPQFVLDYVAAHEVCHLQEMNHGPRFWALVERTMPRMEEARRWLRVYGMDLHRYCPADR